LIAAFDGAWQSIIASAAEAAEPPLESRPSTPPLKTSPSSPTINGEMEE
jgi:hypothetical protein